MSSRKDEHSLTSTHTATIRTLDRDPTRRDGIPCRLITLVLDHNPTPHATLTYRQAAQLGFWLKPGQRILQRTV